MTVDRELILKKFHIERYQQYNTLCVLPPKDKPDFLCYLTSKKHAYCSHTVDAWFHKIDTSQYDIPIDYEEFDKYYDEREVKIIVKNTRTCMNTPLRLIFLDIDGVLVTSKSYQEFKETGKLKQDELYYDEQIAKLLSDFCSQNNFKIVISSTWKLHQDRLQILLDITSLSNYLIFPTLEESCTEHLRWYDSNMELNKLMHNDKFYNQLMEFVPFTRSLEIMKYITKNIGHKPGEDYIIIIDDDSFDVNYWRNKLNALVIKTDTYVGLNENNLEEMNNFVKGLK